MHIRQLLLFLILALSVSARIFAGDVHVSFRVVVPSTLAPLANVYIASSINGWSPSSPVWKMTPASSNEFALELDLPDSLRVEYYYTLGDENCVETHGDGKPRKNRLVIVKMGLLQSDTVARWSMESVNAGRWLAHDVYRYQRLWLFQRLQMTYPESKFPDNPVRKLTNISELDSLLKAVQAEWRTVSMTQYGGTLPDLLSPWYTSILGLIGDRTLSMQAEDYLLEYYQLPAFFREYAALKEEPSTSKTYLLSASLITLQYGIDTFWLETNDSLSTVEAPALGPRALRRKEHWRKLSAIFADAPLLVDQYLANPDLSDELIRSSLAALKLVLEQWAPSWRIMDHLLMQRHDLALAEFHQLRSDGKDGIGLEAYQHIAEPLFQELARKKETESALGVADSIFAAVVRAFPSDTSIWQSYKPLYLRADSVRGLDRYARALAHSKRKSAPQPLHVLAQDGLLTGKFLNIVSDDTVDLAILRGKIAVLDFWTTWCGPCISSIPEINRYAKEISGSPDVVLISILCDGTLGEKSLRRFVSGQKIKYPVLLERQDRSLGGRFGISWYPSMAVINRQGQIDLAPKDATSWAKVKERVAKLRASK